MTANRSSSWDYGIALTPDENAEIDRRLTIEAQVEPLSQYLMTEPAFGGGYTDQAGGHILDIAFATDPSKYEARIRELLPPGALYRLRQVKHSIAELNAVQDRITADRSVLAVMGIHVNAIIVDVVSNVVEVGVAQVDQAAVAVLEARYGTGILRMFGGGQATLTHTGCFSRTHCYGPPLRAGISVNPSGCSLGFVVNQSGQRRILTAGHNPCGSFGGQASHDGSTFGVVQSRSWFGGDPQERQPTQLRSET